MRASSLALAVAALVAVAPSYALAQQAPSTAAPAPPARTRLSLGAPPDPAAFPSAAPAAPTAPGVEVHGFAAGWWTPWSEASPTQARDAFRLRFAVLRVDAQVTPNLSVLARLGLMVPDSPLLDFHATWAPHDAVGVSVGQFRLPLGAAATTLAPQLVMLDRPGYVYSMTKVTFRDVGVMVHSSPRGIADGVLHYWLAAANGAGRVGVGSARAPGPVQDYLYAARVLLDVGRLLLHGPQDRLALGATWARSHDPAINTGSLASDRSLAANTLGRTLAPIGSERDSQLLGADLTFARSGVWAQAELLYLDARAVGSATAREALGASVELAYTLPLRPFDLANVQLAARGERFDPDLAAAGDEVLVGSVGVNVLPTPAWRASLFATVTRFQVPLTGESRSGGELALRLAAAF
jgi:hypothetical protein